ncbi:glyceraldehyde-3-phosphate dehydrogenase type I [Nucleospora cyclopteri]
MKVGINGIGRIGRNVYKILIKNQIDIPLINDPHITPSNFQHALEFDTVYYSNKIIVKKDQNSITCGRITTFITNETDPAKIDWKSYNVDFVIEASGKYNEIEGAEKHSVSKVICCGPSKTIPMFIYGVNHIKIQPNMNIISGASCTTNCLAPIAKLINQKYGIKNSFATTIHAVTKSQSTVDSAEQGRSCFNISPSSTGASKAIISILPELEGKISVSAFRVPVLNVSVIDFVIETEKSIGSIEEICKLITDKESSFDDVIIATHNGVVSSDFTESVYSCILDRNESILLNDKFVKLVCWYDNEHGYACRIVDLLMYFYSLNLEKN